MSIDQLTVVHTALDSQYEIIRELGRGGTALVYLARERATGVEVAIKLIRAKYVEDEEALARFAREARFISQLDHPNIVPLRAVLELGDAGIALVMTHLPGKTLREVIRAEGRLGPERVAQVIRDIAGALGAAHAKGIVHRDVKPENIFIDDSDGRSVLADFGLARSMTNDTQLTMTGVAIGTPAYMAPEQIEGVELDARADVYSLGLVAWEMLSGYRPWDGQSLYAVLYSQKHERLPDVRDLRDDVPDSLAEVILRAIEKDRGTRWQGVTEMLAALDAPGIMPLTERYTPVSADTTRFMRPVPAVPFLPPKPMVEPMLELAESVLEPMREPSLEPSLEPPLEPEIAAEVEAEIEADFGPEFVPEFSLPWDETSVTDVEVDPRDAQRLMIAIGAGAMLAVSLITFASVHGWFSRRAHHETDIAMAPIQAGEVANPVVIRRRSLSGLPGERNTAMKIASPPTGVASAPSAAQAGATRVAAPPIPAADTTKADAAPILPLRPLSSLSAITVPRIDAGTPVVDPVAASTRATVVAGGLHSCLIGTGDHVFCWGNNDRGQLGRGSTARASAPFDIGGDAQFLTLAAGYSHTCALARNGIAWCWGENDHGQVGDRTFSQRLTPVKTADDHVFRSITAGYSHTCGLDASNVAWCWGANAHGQLGGADTSLRDNAVPTAVSGSAARFSSIAAGWSFTCGLTVPGRVLCWGANASGQLGDGSMLDHHTPGPVTSDLTFTAITAGNNHACGVTVQGDAYCWGKNNNGQLGDGSMMDRATPTRVRGGQHFVAITAGTMHTCGITNAGEAYCWGRNTYGQLGNGSLADATQPSAVDGSHLFVSIRAFGSHTCAATRTGEAFCWGYNVEGQLGDGTRVDRTHPVKVQPPTAH